MLLARILCGAFATGALLLALESPKPSGKEVFGRRCSGCHAIDLNKEGPRLRGVWERRAGSVPQFGYSEALKKSGLQWDEETLNRWLSDPEALVPNNDMAFRMGDAEERTAVIAYLKIL